jgi:uncharacterized protein (DUF2461 family)
MTWKQERDLLLAQTMAFVQSVAAKATDTVDILPPRLSPIGQSDLRDEIRRRVAAFRVRQQAFDRDRDAYCNAMMAKARASSEHAAKSRDNPPLKR